MKKSTLTLAIAAALLSTVPVYAQDTGDDAKTLDSVVVTARRVEEKLQEVPLPISAVGEKQITRLGLSSINDIAKVTPGFSFRSGFGREGDRPVIRGQSNIQGEANAAFFIDGVFVNGNISGYGLDNLERVEVIRGPQSALFGRRTFSGAINFITRRPSNTPQGRMTVTAATDSEREVTGYTSGALIDDLLTFTANMRFYEFGGQYRNAVTGIKDLGGQKTGSVGTSLYFTPTDSFEATFRVNYNEDQDEAYALVRQGSGLNNCFPPAASNRSRGFFCGEVRVPEVFAANTNLFAQAGFPAGIDRERLRMNLAMDYTNADNWVLSSVTSYNTNDTLSAIDQDFSSIRGFGGSFETIDFSKGKDLSQEFRVTSDQEASLRGMAGLYYYTERPELVQATSLAGFPAVQPRLDTRPLNSVTNQAVFAMLEWDFADKWTLSGEARYAEDEVNVRGRFNGTLGTQTLTNSVNISKSFTNFLPRGTIKYQATDDLMIYGLVAKGNKPGGFNTAVLSPLLTAAGRGALIAEGLDVFEEEEATTWELGMKSTWWDNQLRLNASVYLIDWTQQQLTETRATPRIDGQTFVSSFTTNLGESTVKGLELDANYQPNANWSVYANAAFNNAKVDRYSSADLAAVFGSPDASGKTLPRVPKTQANLGVDYDGVMANAWKWFVGASLSYESKRFSQLENLNWAGSSVNLNLRGGVELYDNWTVTSFVRNATDDDTAEDVLRYIDPARFIPSAGNFARDFGVTAPRMRQYGMTVQFEF